MGIRRIRSAPRRSRGVALVFVLLMMSMAVAMAVISARVTLLGDKSSRNDRDRQLAFQSAELALNDAVNDIMDPVNGSRSCKFGSASFAAAPACSREDETRGFCDLNPADLRPMYKQVDWNDDSADRKYVRFGEFTARTDELEVGNGTGPSRVPRYVIVKGSSAILVPGTNFSAKGYVIYALGYGTNPETQVMLEAQVTKPIMEKPCVAGSSL